MTTIEEIRKLSDSGCIESPQRVARAIDGMADLRMGEVFSCDVRDVRELFDDLALMHDLEAEVIDQLSYVELTGLIEEICNAVDPVDEMDPEQLISMYVYFLKRVLLEAEKTNPAVRCFMAVRVGAMLDNLRAREGNRKLMIRYEKNMLKDYSVIVSEDEKITKLRDRTVGDVLRFTTEVCCRSWRCWTDIDAYKRGIICACDLDRLLLLSVFVGSFGDRADHRKIVMNHLRYFLGPLDAELKDAMDFDDGIVTEE
ncbi:MAG: hypothetical protein K6B28_01670 [Lachnospiraceae bacterium]|nr:hypothetical protein [Lachnospiraceae bacterium]